MLNRKVKESDFNVFTQSYFGGVFIGFNTLTGHFVSLVKPEFDTLMFALDYVSEHGVRPKSLPEKMWTKMLRGGFVVPESMNEREIIKREYCLQRLNKLPDNRSR